MKDKDKTKTHLSESEKFFNNIFDSIQDGISILDNDLNIIRVNSVMEKWYAHNSPIQGKKCYEVYHGRTKPCEICPSIRTLKTGKPDFDIVPFTGEEGIRGWQELFTFPLMDSRTDTLTGVIEYVRDITERKKTEITLIEEKKKTEAIISAIGDGISIHAPNFRVLYQNKIHKDMVGDHLGEICYMAYAGRKDVCDNCPVSLSFKDGRIHTVERAINTDRGMQYIEVTASSLKSADGTPIAGIEVVRNITDRKKAEAAIAASQKLLDTIIEAAPT